MRNKAPQLPPSSLKRVLFGLTLLLLVIGAFWLFTSKAPQQTTSSPPRLDGNSSLADQSAKGNELAAAIQKGYPQFKIVESKDIDEKGCGVVEGHPGLVEEDFNGDGRKDYMVLLRGDSEKEIESLGKTHKSIELQLVAFLSDENGTYKSSGIFKYDAGLPPFGTYIRLEPQRTLKSLYTPQRDKTVKMTNPGVLLVLCKKSAIVYFWDKRKFQKIWIKVGSLGS